MTDHQAWRFAWLFKFVLVLIGVGCIAQVFVAPAQAQAQAVQCVPLAAMVEHLTNQGAAIIRRIEIEETDDAELMLYRVGGWLWVLPVFTDHDSGDSCAMGGTAAGGPAALNRTLPTRRPRGPRPSPLSATLRAGEAGACLF